MNDEQVILHPLPSRRDKRARSNITAGWCFRACTLVFACIGLLLLLCIAWLAKSVFADLAAPMAHLAHDGHWEKSLSMAGKNATLDRTAVRPLFDEEMPFDIRATVWLDVTEHMRQNRSVPTRTPNGEAIDILHYTLGKNETRSEAILFDGIVLTANSLRSPATARIRLDIPIDPLHTQREHLGPSSLRATFYAIPHGDLAARYGTFVNASSIFPYSPNHLGPNRALPRMRSPHLSSLTLDAALAYAAASTSLLALLPTEFRWSNASECIASGDAYEGNMGIFPFADALPHNRYFIGHAPHNLSSPTCPSFMSEDGRIWLLHVRSRARVMLDRDVRVFDVDRYRKEHEALAEKLQTSSFRLDETGDRQPAPIETLLSFCPPWHQLDRDNGTCDPFPLYYHGPIVRQSPSAASRKHLLQVPSHHTAREASTNAHRGGERQPCRTQLLSPDASKQFYPIDLEIRVSSHFSFRGTLAEAQSPPTKPLLNRTVDSLERVFAKITRGDARSMETLRVLSGDETSRVAHFFTAMQYVFLYIVIEAGILPSLRILYWATRATTEGLSMRAQWILLVARITIHAISVQRGEASLFEKIAGTISLALSTYFTVSCFLRTRYKSATASIFTWTASCKRISRSKISKGVRQSQITEGIFVTWHLVAVIFVVAIALEEAVQYKTLTLLGADVCFDEDHGRLLLPSITHRVLMTTAHAAMRTGQSLQLAFNFHHPRRQAQHDSTRGTFAGSFKITACLGLLTGIPVPALFDSTSLAAMPLMLADIPGILINIVSCYQALTFPGIRQDDQKPEDNLNTLEI